MTPEPKFQTFGQPSRARGRGREFLSTLFRSRSGLPPVYRAPNAVANPSRQHRIPLDEASGCSTSSSTELAMIQIRNVGCGKPGVPSFSLTILVKPQPQARLRYRVFVPARWLKLCLPRVDVGSCCKRQVRGDVGSKKKPSAAQFVLAGC